MQTNPELERQPPGLTHLLPLTIQLDLKHNEEVIFAIRQSPLTPLTLLWPVALGVLGWGVLNAVSLTVAGMPMPMLIQYGILGLSAILGIRWVVRDLLGWFVRWYVLTNQRLVVSHGLLRRHREEAATSRIQTIHVERSNPAANLMDIGDVQVLTASSKSAIYLTGVRRPEEVAYTLVLVQQGKLGAPEQPADGLPASPLESPLVRAALDRMLAEDEEPDDDVVDQRRYLASGLLHRAIDVGMLPGERVLDRVYRHWFVLMARALPPFLVGVAAVLLLAALRAFMPRSAPMLWSLTAIVAIIILLWELLMISNYIDDSFILTNQRIIDVDRSYFIFAESRRETLYRSVQDVSITKPPLGRLFNYGHIHVETAGRAPNIDMRHMSRPRETQERIFALINADREARAEADRKAQRKELHTSVGAVLTALMLVAPDLRALPVATAITRLRAIGLTAVIAGERATADAAPGVVLEQAPSPGATLLRGSEIALTLSRRPQRR